MQRVRLSKESKAALAELHTLRTSGELFTKKGTLRRSPQVRRARRAVALAVGEDLRKLLGPVEESLTQCVPTDTDVVVRQKLMRHKVVELGGGRWLCAFAIYDEETQVCIYTGLAPCETVNDTVEWV